MGSIRTWVRITPSWHTFHRWINSTFAKHVKRNFEIKVSVDEWREQVTFDPTTDIVSLASINSAHSLSWFVQANHVNGFSSSRIAAAGLVLTKVFEWKSCEIDGWFCHATFFLISVFIFAIRSNSAVSGMECIVAVRLSDWGPQDLR